MDNDEKQLRISVYEDSYYDFFIEFWDTVSTEQLIENWHIQYLCDELQKVGTLIIERRKKEYDLIINVSPGESKSTLATVLFPVWLWINDPSLRIISGSYSKDLSIDHATASRDCISSDKFQFYFGNKFEVRKDIDNKSHYQTDSNGYRKAVSTGSAVTGKHAHVIIVDDPINPGQAASDVQMKSANDWINKTLSSRKIDKANTPTILIMQRLHKDDPTGNALSKNKSVKHISIPATDEYDIIPAENAKYYVDGLMNPHRTGFDVLAEAKTDLGEREYAGQYGQSPQAKGGNMVKGEWFGRYKLWEIELLIEKGHVVPHFYIDTALSEKEQKNNDPSGILVFAHYQNRLYLLYYFQERMGFPDLIDKIKGLYKEWAKDRRSKVIIENKANGASVRQQLIKTTNIPILLENIKGGKLERLEVETPTLESGRVFLPEGEAWVSPWLQQVLVFPSGKHDECIDTLTGAMRMTFNRKKSGSYGAA